MRPIGGDSGNDTDPVWSEPTPESVGTSADRIVNGERTPEYDHLCGLIEFVTPDTKVPERKLVFLHEYWKTIRDTERRLPMRRDIDVLELREAIGNIMMLDVLDDGFDARYRVYGTGVVEYAGHDWTESTVSEMCRKTRTPLALMYRACYLAVYRTGQPLYTESKSPSWLAPKAWRRMILPYADEDGGCIGFMVGNVPVEPGTLGRNPEGSLIYRKL
ncbi:PAS domain-containing protein [Nisaea sp.]|uniref:PAS domain-containing protein n=1 Tax=Nisaea sp. TaxID=2024842 RepID=UPI0032EF8D38